MEGNNENINNNLEVGEEIQRVCKSHADMEASLKRSKLLLEKMKQTVNQVHVNNEGILESLKTLPLLAEGLKLEELAKSNQ